VASVSGSVQDTYRGEGRFHVHAGLWDGIFSITSLARPNSDAQVFSLFKLGTAAPAPGRYALTGAASPDNRQPHFAAQYLRRSGAFAEAFTAVDGELQITVATAERVEGTFRFRGVRDCMGPPQDFRCSHAHPPDLSQPMVDVTGSFVAVPDGAGVPR
jgi:hypothetical protein